MAIQTINLTVPGGDTPRSANTKINANFTDPTNAASKVLGIAPNNVCINSDLAKAIYTKPPRLDSLITSKDANDIPVGTFGSVLQVIGWVNIPPNTRGGTGDGWAIQCYGSDIGGNINQIAISYFTGEIFRRTYSDSGAEGWRDWVPVCTSAETYKSTTANGANVVVDTTGRLMRSTSSERYKDILSPLELDDARYADAMALKPIVYRSTADADNPAYHYYSFSAEVLGAYDPAFTLWRETEAVTDKDGNVIEQPLAERQAEGININALLAMGHAIAIKQGELIKDLQDQAIEQKEAIAALKQTNL